jgi:PAS domain S-box-containing protein
MLHRDYKVLYANKAFVDLYGYDSEQEILDIKSTQNLIAPETWDPSVHHPIYNGDDEQSDMELICVKKDGTLFLVHRRSFLIDWEGQPIICTARIDISERKRLKNP